MTRSSAGFGRGAPASVSRDPKSANSLRRIVWTDQAVENLETIVTYISAFNEVAAARLAERLIDMAESLSDFSHRGRDAGKGRREMTIVPPYILQYRVVGNEVTILRLRHGARQPED